MGHYIFIIVLVSLFALFENKDSRTAGLPQKKSSNQFGLIIITAILTFYSAVRYATGSDCLSYYNYFDYDNDMLFAMYERGFAYLYVILGMFFNNGQSLIVVTSIIINVLIVDAIRRLSPRPYFSLFCYVCFYYYFLSFNILRQFVGIAIVLWGIQFLFKKTKKGYIVFAGCCLLASTFHYSAIFSLLMIPLQMFKQNNTIKIGFLILIIAGYVLDTFFISWFASISKYLDYSGAYGITNSANTSIILLAFFLLASWSLEKDLEKLIENYHFYENCIAFGLFLNVIAETNIMFGRMAYYFTTVIILFIPMLIAKMKKSSLIKFVVIGAAIAYCVWNLNNNNGGVNPYHFYFNQTVR